MQEIVSETRKLFFIGGLWRIIRIPRLLFRFFNESYEGTAEGKLCLPVFVTRFILEIFPLRWKDFIDFSMGEGREK